MSAVTTPKPAAPLLVVYRVLLTQIATRARVAGLVGLGAIFVLLGLIGGQNDPTDADAVGLMANLGLAVLLPVGSLIFASGAMADLREDRTLVYLWLRPMRQWVVPTAAFLAALTPVLPVTVLAGVLAALFVGQPDDLATSMALAMAFGAIAYCAVFVAFGLLVKRTLLYGLMYILIWEGFIAAGGRGAARLAIRAYTRSIVSSITDHDLELADFSLATSVVVLTGIAVVSIWFAVTRYSRMDVD
jgi:ABC-2 type transport system permease protein